jgi:hypothetical protein
VADYTPIYAAGLLPSTATASAGIVGGQLVEVSGNGTVGPAAAGSVKTVGVAAHDAGSGGRLTVHPVAGVVHELVAGASVTAGQPVKVGATSGAVLPLSGGAPGAQVGVALTTAAQDAKVQVLGTPPTPSGATAVPTLLFASTSLNFPSIAAAGQAELTITVTGAAVGDGVVLAPPAAPEAGLVWAGRVSATNTVTVRASNITAAPVDPAAATWGAHVIKST